MTITMHLCRGNYKSTFMGTGGYEAEQEILFNRIKVHGYFMEYDSDRAGGFEPLKLVPKDRQVVLGLVTTKTGRLESKDDLKRRIDEATKYISLDQLCLSPQCGFASTEEGNTSGRGRAMGQAQDDRRRRQGSLGLALACRSNAEKLLALKIPDVEQSYGPKDCMLYALGLGLGQDPLNADELAFVYEKNLKVLPTYALVQGYSAYWLRQPDLGITWSHVVHGEQGLLLHEPVAPQGNVIGRTRILDVVDKGEGKGALVYSERAISDKASGRLLATLTQTTFCRADGGFGGSKRETPPPHALPERAPDIICDLPTRPEMALIYRLSGDVNPLHADPEFAKAAGFPRPILHGLATFGVAGHALLKAICGYDPARLTAISGRFSAPVFPGETIRTEFWHDGGVVSFRARVMERDAVVIDNGRAQIKQ